MLQCREVLLQWQLGKGSDVEIATAIRLQYQAWGKVASNSIANCYKHAGFDINLQPPEQLTNVSVLQVYVNEEAAAHAEDEYVDQLRTVLHLVGQENQGEIDTLMSVEEFIGIAQENVVVPVAQSLDELRNLELQYTE